MGMRDTYPKLEMFLRAVDSVLASTKQHVAETRGLLDRVKERREA